MAEGKRASNWTRKLEEVRQFATDQNRWPSTTSNDDNEKKLGQWWSRSKYQYKKFKNGDDDSNIDADRAKDIENLINQLSNLERDGVWQSRLETVRQQVEREGRLWRYDVQDPEAQQNLRWFNQQKTFLKKYVSGETKVGGMTEHRCSQIRSVLSMLSDDSEDNSPINPSTTNKVTVDA